MRFFRFGHIFWLYVLAVGMLLVMAAYGYRHYLPEALLKTALYAEIAGDDRICWEQSPEGIKAVSVHPLLRYQSEPYLRAQIPEYILQGDLLRKIDYLDVYQASVADTLSRFSPPGRIFIYELERKAPSALQVERVQPFVKNGYRLSFSFNDKGHYWSLMLWVLGIGLFVQVLIMFILLPLLREKRSENRRLRFFQWAALALFVLQLLRYGYWFLDNENTHFEFEKAYIVAFTALASLCAWAYFCYEWEAKKAYEYLPALLWVVGSTLFVYQLVYVRQQLKYYHEWIELLVYAGFYLPLALGSFAALWNEHTASWTQKLLRLALGLVSLGYVVYFAAKLCQPYPLRYDENHSLLWGLLQFVPVYATASLRLKFGKVSLVLTQSVQLLIFFSFALFVFLAVNQLFQQWFAQGSYRPIFEGISTLVLVLLARALYNANERRIRKYFVLSQQEKEDKVKAFLARIPQYTSPRKLKEDLVAHLQEYVGTAPLQFYWKGDLEIGDELPAALNARCEEIYGLLKAEQQIWSKNKELSGFVLGADLEQLAAPFNLIFSVSVNEDNYGLMFLGEKYKGVYNLSDIELISQLLRQTRLTLNVLLLVQREKSLIQQTYQANLTALRSQINPHFLFNTLNTISALIHDSPDLAEEAVEKLAFIFRYTLKTSDQNFVPFSAELKLVQTYLEIEQIRFGERLEVMLEVEEAALEVEIPAFVVQTIVENCIKHGIAKIVGRGVVHISAMVQDGLLKIDVYDNGPGIQQGRERQGTGLKNIIVRLENIYAQPDVIRFVNTGEGTVVSLRIPLAAT